MDPTPKRAFRHRLVWSIVNTLLLFVIALFLWASATPEFVFDVEKSGDYVSPRSTFRFAFDRPISRQVTATIEPAVAGNWSFEDFVVSTHVARTLVFTPEVSLAPDTEYRIRISGVHNVLTPNVDAYSIDQTFRTPPVPTVASVAPNERNENAPDIQWVVTLDRPNVGLADFEFVTEPSIELTATPTEDDTAYTLVPKGLLDQGTTYRLTVLRRGVQYFIGSDTVAFQSDPVTVFEDSWVIREAPGVASTAPSGDTVKRSEDIMIAFTEPMDVESFLSGVRIDPALPGTWKASDDHATFTYSSGNMAFATSYVVTAAAGIRTALGGYLEADIKHTFTTIGAVKVQRFSPHGGATGVGIGSTLQVTFDQSVDHFSAEKAFSLLPAVDGTFSWDGNTMVFHPASPLSFDASYSISVAPGIVSIDGLNSTQTFSSSFSTELSQTKLAVPFHRQERPLSCEAATLTMALRYRGVNISESTLIEQIGYDTTPHVGDTWGNPHIAFVGDYYGKQVTTGYGVYWQPISRVANLYRSARWFTNGTIQDVTAEIQKGNPVIVWGNAASGRRSDWKTPEGETVIAIVGEHTRVVIGFVGTAANPSKIITLDPLSGERYFSTSSFESNWALLGKAGVVVE